jgi:hypothetical protein
MLMNRIYRRVWNRQLNALVVASELATGDSGGSAARDPRAFLLMPTALALALLCALASGHAGASESISRCVICRLLQPSTRSRCRSRSTPKWPWRLPQARRRAARRSARMRASACS